MSWRNNVSEERNRVAASTIADGEYADFLFQDDGKEVETKAGDAVEFQVEYQGSSDGSEHTDMNGDALEEGEDYTILTSSSRLLYALADTADSLSGATVRITAEGTKDSFSRTYSVEVIDA